MSEVLPPGWTRTTLGQIGRYLNGRAFKKSEWSSGGRPIVRIQNLTGTSESFNHFDGDLEERHIARRGDLLVSWAATLGAYIWPGPEAAVNQHIFKVESHIDVRFHKYLIDHALEQLARHTHGSGIVHITRGRFDSVPVLLPPLDEQHRMVAVLEDHLSRLGASGAYLDAAATRTSHWRRSSVDAVIASEGGRTTTLRDLIQRVEAGRSFGGTAPPARDDEWGVVRVSSMTWGEFRPHENKAVPEGQADPRYEIHEGDVLVSRANTTEYVGAPVLVKQTRPRLLLSDKSLRLVPIPGVDPGWLVSALGTRGVRRQISALATGTKDSMRNISQANLMSVVVPSAAPEEQCRARETAAEITLHAARIERSLARAHLQREALRRRLLSAAFSGQL